MVQNVFKDPTGRSSSRIGHVYHLNWRVLGLPSFTVRLTVVVEYIHAFTQKGLCVLIWMHCTVDVPYIFNLIPFTCFDGSLEKTNVDNHT